MAESLKLKKGVRSPLPLHDDATFLGFLFLSHLKDDAWLSPFRVELLSTGSVVNA